jgi:hypothetical protein
MTIDNKTMKTRDLTASELSAAGRGHLASASFSADGGELRYLDGSVEVCHFGGRPKYHAVTAWRRSEGYKRAALKVALLSEWNNVTVE